MDETTEGFPFVGKEVPTGLLCYSAQLSSRSTLSKTVSIVNNLVEERNGVTFWSKRQTGSVSGTVKRMSLSETGLAGLLAVCYEGFRVPWLLQILGMDSIHPRRLPWLAPGDKGN